MTGPSADPPPARVRRQRADHALGDLLEIGLALAQVLVLHLVELARQHLSSWAATAHSALWCRSSIHWRVALASTSSWSSIRCVQQRDQFGGRVALDIELERLELLADLIAGRLQPADLGTDLIRLDEIVATSTRLEATRHRAPDGHARETGNEYLNAHGAMLSAPPPARTGIGPHPQADPSSRRHRHDMLRSPHGPSITPMTRSDR